MQPIRLLFEGDPAAAAPWVGLAKKLARQTFMARIRNKTYVVANGVQIRVENLLPQPEGFGSGVTQQFGGTSKVWIKAGGTSLIYQFDCTTPNVVFANNGGSADYFADSLYTSSMYLTIPLVQQPADSPVRVAPYGSAIEDSGSDNSWRFTQYPMALTENVKLNKKNANHQIQGVNEPVFWIFKPDEIRETLPVEKRYAPIDGRLRTYFITEGKLLFSGLSLVCNSNNGSDICYDERGTELGLGKLSSRDTRSPNCDWYQASGVIQASRRYEMTIDASNRLFVWPAKGDYSTTYTTSLYSPQAFGYNVTDPVVVDIQLPEYSVLPNMSFRDFFATHVDSVFGRYTQVAPRYHWKIRHDGKKIAAIINLREPMTNIPRYKRWLINDYRYNDLINFPDSYNPTMLDTDFGEAYYHLNPKQAYYNDPRLRFDDEIQQPIAQERTAVVVYSVDLVEEEDGTFSVSLTLDSVSPAESTRMPFSVGFAEPHPWSLGVEDGDVLVASVRLTQSETMKRISSHHIGGDTLGFFHAKKDVFVRNERTGLDVFSLCMQNSDLDGLLATVDMPTETFSTEAHYFNLATMSFMFGLRYFDINQQETMKESVSEVDWYQVYTHHAGAILVYAYGELVSQQLLHSTRSIDLITQFNDTAALTHSVTTDWTGNLYGVGAWYDENDAVRRYSAKGTFWWGEKASSQFSLDYPSGDDGVVINKAQFETAFRSFNSTVDPHNILPNYFPCTITDFIQQVIDELWWRIEWLAASSDCAITYGLAQFVCENKGLSYFSAGVERFVGICASAVYEIAEQQGFDLDAGQYTEAGKQLQDFVSSFYISDYPLGNHVYHNSIEQFHSDGWYSDVITFPGANPHVSYYSSPIVSYEGTLPILTLGRYHSYIYEINRYVYPDEYALLGLNKFISTSPDGLIIYSGHLDKEQSFTHLDLYNQAFNHTYTINDFYQPPIELYPGDYRTGVYVKLGDDQWSSLINFAGGSLAYPIASSKGSPPAYPLLRVNALFTYF